VYPCMHVRGVYPQGTVLKLRQGEECVGKAEEC